MSHDGKIVFSTGEEFHISVDFIRTSTYNPLCDMCQTYSFHVSRVIKNLHEIALFTTDKLEAKRAINVTVPLVHVKDKTPNAVIDWLVDYFGDSIKHAGIAALSVKDETGDLIDEWPIGE